MKWLDRLLAKPKAALPEKQVFTVTMACRAKIRADMEEIITNQVFSGVERGRFVVEEGEQAFIDAVRRVYP